MFKNPEAADWSEDLHSAIPGSFSKLKKVARNGLRQKTIAAFSDPSHPLLTENIKKACKNE